MRGRTAPLGLHLGLGHAAEQVRAHVVRLGWRRVVGVAADVEVVIVLAQRGVADTMALKPGDVGEGVEGVTIFSMCSGSR
jgi:hypothetical protein